MGWLLENLMVIHMVQRTSKYYYIDEIAVLLCALFNRLKNWMNQQILSEEKEEAYRDSKTNRFNFKMCEFDQENNCDDDFVWLWN